MPTFTTSEEWTHHSALLLRARPSTTRIVSKYTIVDPTSARSQKLLSRAAARRAKAKSSSKTIDGETTAAAAAAAAPAPTAPRATFELKTYDAHSGVCLKYRTDKAAEVGRLVASLGRLGREMAALPERKEELEDTTMADAPALQQQDNAPAAAAAAAEKSQQAENKSSTAGAGGKNKKKKGGKK